MKDLSVGQWSVAGGVSVALQYAQNVLDITKCIRYYKV